MIYRVLISIFLFILTVFSIIYIYRCHFWVEDYGNGFIAGDWLINYQDGGFKRRGLSGSLAFIIQDISGMRLSMIVFLWQILAWVGFIMVFLLLVWKKSISILYFTLVVSPLTFLAYFNDLNFLGRKEYILFLLFTGFGYLLSEKNLSRQWDFIICILIAIGVLLHEIVLFYFPYFLIALYLTNPQSSYKRYAGYLISAFLPALLILLFGGNIEQGRSISILMERGIQMSPHNIFNMNPELDIGKLLEERGYRLYFFSLGFGIMHFGYFIMRYLKPYFLKLMIFTGFAFLFSLPLFFLAYDWGRWLQVHFVLSLVLVTILLKNRESIQQPETGFLAFIKREYVSILLLPVLFSWAMHHMGTGYIRIGAVKSVYYLLSKELTEPVNHKNSL